MRKTVRVFFANCPHLDEAAAAYIVLAQNAVQSVFEFEIWHFDVYGYKIGAADAKAKFLSAWSQSSMPLPWKRWAGRRYVAHVDKLTVPTLARTLPHQGCIDSIRPFLKRHDEWITGLPVGQYGNWTIKPAPTLIVTETPIESGYFGLSEGDIAIASISDWRKRFTPPSLLEFMLNQVQRHALRLTINNRIGNHYPTRACIWDFAANFKDARLSPLVGYVCDACEQLIVEQATPVELEQIRDLLSHKWIGKTDEPGSVASNLRRAFGYDLVRTRGLSAGFFDQVREATSSELVKLVFAGVAGIATLLFGIWVARHANGPVPAPTFHLRDL